MLEFNYEDYKRFAHRWVENLIDGLDAHLDEETKMKIVEPCGRACARGDGTPFAEQCRGNVDRFLTMLRRWHGGEETVRRDGDVITILCNECLCPLVRDESGELSGTYCYCSLGWMKENFETVVGKPVEIELVESIKRGAQRCRFTIRI